MFRITNNNFNDILEAIVKAYKNSTYDENCFSSGDVRREIEASNELDRIVTKLENLNVDFKKFIAPIYKKFDIEVNENYSSNLETEDFPKVLNLEINCNTLEHLLNQEDKHFIVEGHEPAEKNEFYIQIQDSARFAYQQWDISNEAITELRKVKKFDEIFKVSNKFTLNKNLESISVIRDLYSNNEIDCSSILLEYQNGEDNLLVCGAIGGFYKDIAIVDKGKLIDVVPIFSDKENKYSIRTLNKEITVKVDRETGQDYVSVSTPMHYKSITSFLDSIYKYKDMLLNLAE